MRRLAPLLLLILLLPACGRQTDSGYFPLEKGGAWEYTITYKVRGEMRTQKLIYRNGGTVKAQDQRYYVRINLNGKREYYRKTKDDIYRVDPISGKHHTVLVLPPDKGQEWHSDSKIRVLDITGVYTPTFRARIVNPVDLTYRIEATDDEVTVPAGTFSNCLRIRATGSLFPGQTLQENLGMQSINVDETEWYAPGVGLVKVVRREFTKPNKFSNTYTQVLDSYASK